MSVRASYWRRARKVYVGTVGAAALLGFGLGPVNDGIAMLGIGTALTLTWPLSMYAYPLLAYSLMGLVPWEPGIGGAVFALVSLVAGFALVALVQFELLRAACRCLVWVARQLAQFRSPA